jgi:Na+(H+)/acetate symporter ActP
MTPLFEFDDPLLPVLDGLAVVVDEALADSDVEVEVEIEVEDEDEVEVDDLAVVVLLVVAVVIGTSTPLEMKPIVET